MPLFGKKKKEAVTPPDPFSSWGKLPQTSELPPLPDSLSTGMQWGEKQAIRADVFDPALVVGLASAGAQILHAVNTRLLADGSNHHEHLTYFIVGEQRDYEIADSDEVYTEIFAPRIDSDNYRQAYADCLTDANIRTRFFNCLHNRFGSVESNFKTYIVGSLREAAAAAISDLAMAIKGEYPNSEIILFLTLEMMDDIDLVRDGEMLAQLRELSRMTYKTYHVHHRLNRVPNASLETSQPTSTVLIDQIFLFDARDVSKRDENFVLDSVQEVAEGLFNYLSTCSHRIFERYSNVRAYISQLKEDLAEPLFSTLTAKALVFPLNYLYDLAENELIFTVLLEEENAVFSNRSNSEHVDAFIKSFIGHKYQYQGLIDWLANRIKQPQDMRVLPNIDCEAGIRTFRYVLLDVTNQFLNSTETGHDLKALSRGVKRICTWLENAYRIGLQNHYSSTQAQRWMNFEKYLIETKKACSQLLVHSNGWQEKVHGRQDDVFSLELLQGDTFDTLAAQIKNSLENARHNAQEKLEPSRITKFSHSFHELQRIISELIQQSLPKVRQHLVWKAWLSADKEMRLTLVIKNGPNQESHSEFTYENAEHFIKKIKIMVPEFLAREFLQTKIVVQGENQDFLAEITAKSGLSFDHNAPSMNVIWSKVNAELLEIAFLIHSGNLVNERSLGDIAEEIFGGSYSSAQKELVADGCKHRLSILKLNNIIPYDAVRTIAQLSRDYRYRYHLLPQEWNTKILENEINEYQTFNFYDGTEKDPFRIVPQIQACMWSPILFEIFFFALFRGVIKLTQTDSALGHEFWQVEGFDSYEPLKLSETVSLLEAFKAFTLTRPLITAEANQFYPFTYQNRLSYLRGIHQQSQTAEILPQFTAYRYLDNNLESQCFGAMLEFMYEKNRHLSRIMLEIAEPLFTFRTP